MACSFAHEKHGDNVDKRWCLTDFGFLGSFPGVVCGPIGQFMSQCFSFHCIDEMSIAEVSPSCQDSV